MMLLALLGLCTTIQANFAVSKINPQVTGAGLIIEGQLELPLPVNVEEAVNKGIPLDIRVDLRLYRQRAWWWNRLLASWQLQRQVRLHALSGQYLVTEVQNCRLHGRSACIPAPEGSIAKASESASTLAEALTQLGELTNLFFDLNDIELSDGNYVLEVRTELDIESLPPPLRPVAYTLPSWHLDSGWTSWTVTR
jgi:hypothetical protein